ncbi:glucokinase [Actinomadura sp. 7K534]|uniref:glucokinase n=1 Tax=Actinomadura sp. 7K534 TaxID=2530366 RepID=UPI001404DFC7|nr:glucokinase [Actinomadura sp. 7K534]
MTAEDAGIDLLYTSHAGIDIGGTRARMRYVDPRTGEIRHVETRCGQYASLDDVLRACFALAGCVPRRLVAGVAGRVLPGGDVHVTNQPSWPVFSKDAFAAAHGIDLRIVNDLVATAMGTAGLDENGYRPLLPGEDRAAATARLVVAIGTGVGAAIVDADGNVRSSEAGHVPWQPVSGVEAELLRFVRASTSAPVVTVEQVLGGLDGFRHLYDFLRARRGTAPELRTGGADAEIGPLITAAACAGDEFCRELLALYGGILGQFLRGLLLVSLPEGAEIWLGGSVLQAPRVADLLMAETPFRERMVSRGAQHADLMRRVPVLLITAPDVAVQGAFAHSRPRD